MKNTVLKLEHMEPENNWIDLIKWISAWVSGTFATVWGVNTFINKYFDWKKNQQQQFIEQVIDRKVGPELTDIKESIEELKKMFWDLKKEVINK